MFGWQHKHDPLPWFFPRKISRCLRIMMTIIMIRWKKKTSKRKSPIIFPKYVFQVGDFNDIFTNVHSNGNRIARVAPTISTSDNASDRNNGTDVISGKHQRVEILNSIWMEFLTKIELPFVLYKQPHPGLYYPSDFNLFIQHRNHRDVSPNLDGNCTVINQI